MGKFFWSLLYLIILPFLALRLVGMPGLLAYGVLCLLIFPRKETHFPLADRFRTPYRFFVWVAVFISLTSLFTWLFYATILAEITETKGFIGFLLGSVETRIFWSAIIGLLEVVSLLGLLIWATCYAAVKTGLMSYEGLPPKDAMQVNRDVILGINKIVQMIKDDDVQILNKPAEGTARFGGYGFLIVQDGYAAVLEKGGKPTRVAGGGVYTLQPFERVSMAVSLRSQFADGVFEKIPTRDGVLIQELKLLIFAKVDDGKDVKDDDDHADAIRASRKAPEGSLFHYNEFIIKERLWKVFGTKTNIKESIKRVLLSIADNQLRAVISRYTLDEIFVPGGDPLKQSTRDMLKKEIAAAINKITQGFLGIKVTGTDIGYIKVPEDAERRLLDKWMADWDQRIAKTRADTEVYVREAEARARMETIASYAEGLKQISNVSPTPENILALRLIELLEKKGESASKGEEAVDTLLRIQSLEAMIPRLVGRT